MGLVVGLRLQQRLLVRACQGAGHRTSTPKAWHWYGHNGRAGRNRKRI